MQLNLAFHEPTEPPSSPAPSPASAAWEQLGEAKRLAALDLLARLIARMLASAPSTESGNE